MSINKANGIKNGHMKITNILRINGHPVSPNIILMIYLTSSNIYNFHVKDLKK